MLKDGQRSHLSAEAATMQATVYGAASARRATIERTFQPGKDIVVWEDADLDSLGLTRYGHDKETLQSAVPAQQQRCYNCWTEDWELEILSNHDIEAQASLLAKYGGITFADGEGDKITYYQSHSRRMHFNKEYRNNRYMLFACKEGYVHGPGEDEPATGNDSQYDVFDLDDDLHGLIFEYYRKNPVAGFRCVAPEGALDEDGAWNLWAPEPPEPKKKKRKKGKPKRG